MRYAWDLDTYLDGSSWSLPSRVAARTVRPILRRWDVATAKRPDVVVAISTEVQERIARRWGRASEVIFPPVDVAAIPVTRTDDGYLLVAARMLAYRRLDLAVIAANRLGRELIVVGDGPERARLEALAGPTVRFEGWVARERLVDLFTRCHAYLVPGIEDFGIAPVEAMAAGKPVVGIRAGGLRDTLLEDVTGVFFDSQEAEALVAAIQRLDEMTFDPSAIRAHAATVFRRRWRELLEQLGVEPSLYSTA
jgi:glycosyltransferase involved in cell wall biosynthesis